MYIFSFCDEPEDTTNQIKTVSSIPSIADGPRCTCQELCPVHGMNSRTATMVTATMMGEETSQLDATKNPVKTETLTATTSLNTSDTTLTNIFV